jgi:hypothetical protein
MESYESCDNLNTTTNITIIEPHKPEKSFEKVAVVHFNSIYKTTKTVSTNINSVWSGYHKDYTPLTDNPKGIIFRINNDCKTVTIVSNTLNNYFDETLNIEDVYVIFKLS